MVVYFILSLPLSLSLLFLNFLFIKRCINRVKTDFPFLGKDFHSLRELGQSARVCGTGHTGEEMVLQ